MFSDECAEENICKHVRIVRSRVNSRRAPEGVIDCAVDGKSVHTTRPIGRAADSITILVKSTATGESYYTTDQNDNCAPIESLRFVRVDAVFHQRRSLEAPLFLDETRIQPTFVLPQSIPASGRGIYARLSTSKRSFASRHCERERMNACAHCPFNSQPKRIYESLPNGALSGPF